MKIKVIVQIAGLADPHNVRHHLLQHHRIDFTSLIELALLYWDEVEDDEGLRTALEHYINQRNHRAIRRMERDMMSYEEFLQLTHALALGIHQIHEQLFPILTPIAKGKLWGRDAEYRLARHMGMDAAAVIEIQPRLE